MPKKISAWIKKVLHKNQLPEQPPEETTITETQKIVTPTRGSEEPGRLTLTFFSDTDANDIALDYVRKGSSTRNSKGEIDQADDVCTYSTCTKDCFTCGPPAIARNKKSIHFAESVKETAIEPTEEHIPSHSSQHSTHINEESLSKPALVAAPIRDEKGNLMSNLNLSDALALLMKQGIVETPRSLAHTDGTEVLKTSANKSSSSSEASNVEILMGLNAKKYRPKQQFLTPVQQCKSDPVAKVDTVDECVNTSFQSVARESSFDDGIVKIKFQRRLDDDSCTQYFAIRSNLNLDAYLKDMRQQNQDNIQTSHDESITDDILVSKQQAKLALSLLSTQSDTVIDKIMNDDLTSEKELAIHSPGFKSASDVIVPLKLSDAKITEKRQSKDVKQKKCRTCHVSKSEKRRTQDQSTLGEIPHDLQQKTSCTTISLNESQTSRDSSIFDILLSNNVMPEEKAAQLILVFQRLKVAKDLLNLQTSKYNITEQSPNFMFSWKFLKHAETHYFSLENLKEESDVEINESRLYNFDMTPGIYLFLLKCPIAIELYNVTYSRETLIGKCNLNLGRCFDDISMIYESSVQIQNKDLCLCYDDLKPMQFGKLIIRFRMRGSQVHFDQCKPIQIPIVKIPPLIEKPETRSSRLMTPTTPTLHHDGNKGNIVSEAELQAFQDGLNLVLVRNKALRTTQEEITQELKDRTTWMHEELKWRLTLQENAILSGKDPEAIKWRQWKDDTTAKVRYRPISHEEYLKDGIAHIEIEIQELTLYADSKPMLNESIRHLYIEVAFLSENDREMETLSMQKPIDEKQAVKFHFIKMFDIKVESEQAISLAEMIKNNESIPFSVIAQPTENRNELQSCYDVGTANLILFDLLQCRHNTTVETIPVHDAYAKEVEIGKLRVRFVGVLAMRSMALHILTPATFKIVR